MTVSEAMGLIHIPCLMNRY